MIKASDLITAFHGYLASHDGYIPNTSGETWTAEKQAKATGETVQKYGSQWIGHRVEDCSGAFVRAYRQHGLSIYHGSNRIAREYVVQLLPPSYAKPGMAAFKAYKPGDKYYALPIEYKPGGKHYNGDVNDYYHIGLVDDDPAYVINAQSTRTGVARSKLANGWVCVGRLKAVQYDEGSKETMQRRVIGGKLNLREKPDTNSNRIAQIPDGAIVTVDEYGDKWCRVEYNSKVGYAVTQFLAPVPDEAPEEPPAPDAPASDELLDWLGKAIDANAALTEALEHMQVLLTGAVG